MYRLQIDSKLRFAEKNSNRKAFISARRVESNKGKLVGYRSWSYEGGTPTKYVQEQQKTKKTISISVSTLCLSLSLSPFAWQFISLYLSKAHFHSLFLSSRRPLREIVVNKLLYKRIKTMFCVFVTFSRAEVTMGLDWNFRLSATRVCWEP